MENLEEALCLVWKTFLEYEAPDYSDEGVQAFKQFIELESIKQKILQNHFYIWVCFDKEKIVGVLATRQPCHISLLFVDSDYHRQGIARAMVNIMVDYYKSNYDAKEITVSSSPYAKEVYHRLGFYDTDTEQTESGIRFIPMKRLL